MIFVQKELLDCMAGTSQSCNHVIAVLYMKLNMHYKKAI